MGGWTYGLVIPKDPRDDVGFGESGFPVIACVDV